MKLWWHADDAMTLIYGFMEEKLMVSSTTDDQPGEYRAMEGQSFEIIMTLEITPEYPKVN